MPKTVLFETMEDEINCFIHKYESNLQLSPCDCGRIPPCPQCLEYAIMAESLHILELYGNELERVKATEQLVKRILRKY